MSELERIPANAVSTEQTTGNDIENLPSLIGRLGDNIVTLLDAKLSLLKAEAREEAAVYARGGAFIAVGAVIALVGLVLVNVAIAFFISSLFNFSEAVNYAIGFTITGIIYLVVGGIIVVVMKNRLGAHNPVPPKTVEELRKDQQWLKNEM